MRYQGWLLQLLGGLLLCVSACGCSLGQERSLAIAKAFLVAHGMEVVREPERPVVQKVEAKKLHPMQVAAWDLQQKHFGTRLADYEGREVHYCTFIVRWHPIISRCAAEGVQEAQVTVWVTDGKVIGGISMPVGPRGEVYTGLGYPLLGP
ncbi:MAG: hypothetical protein QMC81_01810 [Thermoanaerobacterales bacterium]|nr:hypothetical protein [Thermoanaerobacterales bacterium]